MTRDHPARLRIAGRAAGEGRDPASGDGEELLLLFGEEEEEEDGGAGNGPQTTAELRSAFADLHRDTGLRVGFGGDTPLRQVYEDPGLRITGNARVPVVIRR